LPSRRADFPSYTGDLGGMGVKIKRSPIKRWKGLRGSGVRMKKDALYSGAELGPGGAERNTALHVGRSWSAKGGVRVDFAA